MSLTAKWYLFGLSKSFAGGFAAAFLVGSTGIAPELMQSPARFVLAAGILGGAHVATWWAGQQNPFEPDTLSIKHLPDDQKGQVKQLLADNGLTEKGKTQ